MLSLKGSIQPDPFSPYHVPQPAVPFTNIDLEVEVDDLINDSDEEDLFGHLGRAADEALERAAAEKERLKSENVGEKEKKKRKEKRKERQDKGKELATALGASVAGQVELSKEEKPPKKRKKPVKRR
ncbi:uncharacterized protein FOMMEDRAFT_156197 [Fomitiporia mediterranea MF3/22]|uniref:uncharacterized protein n=1 Tax=Fomitiporia mediterranea (strain MF3/22) TaxID=694068 RepID=UPI0004408C17|nr:uncharacterized protein FOMMEDRAFT_156197 [Fomitiporia mediterranea MF3/22]EJD02840.1 hypothetical protein FOMMEDRAFT_156197 [Fomitiporia mediterranea MF3/22]